MYSWKGQSSVDIGKRREGGYYHKGDKRMIAIWIIGVIMLWLFNLVSFNNKGYWTFATYMSWIAVWTVVFVIAMRIVEVKI